MTGQKKRDTSPKVTPRQVADKSSPSALRLAIKMALESQSESVRSNTQKFNRARYVATAEIEDYETLKDRARRIKEDSIADLDSLIKKLEEEITSRGGFFFLAADAQAARDYITTVCVKHNARLVVKAKSMTSEEIRLNSALEKAGIEVAETDLAEFILQIADEQPSHIVVPAIHRSRESISKLFINTFHTEKPLEKGEDLTRFARDILRDKFLSADIGISGANVISAESGTIVLVESEGNIRMVCQAPPVHIALAGVEKIVPARTDLATFIELLGPSGTGQPLTTYTQVIRPPLDLPAFSFGIPGKSPQREFHLVLLDNGRMRMREDAELRQALYCIRCGACLNSCAVFQTIGGHAFGGETYSGGIGGCWEAGTAGLQKARFCQLCTGCSRCIPQCPVRIDIPWLNTILRDRLSNVVTGNRFLSLLGKVIPASWINIPSSLPKYFFGFFGTSAKWVSRFHPLSDWIIKMPLSRLLLEKVFNLERRRELPLVTKPFRPGPSAAPGKMPKGGVKKAVLFSDVYTSFTRPNTFRATMKVLEAAGVDLTTSQVKAEGRAELSQGLLSTARGRANNVAGYLEQFIDRGQDIVVIEPSVLALFRHDYRHLLKDNRLFDKLKNNSYDTIEYLIKILHDLNTSPESLFTREKLNPGEKIFIHGHCQQKSINSFRPAVSLFESLGFDVEISDVECCGMAGSFGYKKDYYELSMKIGEDLFRQIDFADKEKGKMIVLAAGISCCEQISAGTGREVMHPMELLEKMLKR